MEPTGMKNAFLQYREQQAHQRRQRRRMNSRSNGGDAKDEEGSKTAEGSEVDVLFPLVSQSSSHHPPPSPAILSSADSGDRAEQQGGTRRRGVKRTSDLHQLTYSNLAVNGRGAADWLSGDSSLPSPNQQTINGHHQPITSFAEAKELALARRQMIFVHLDLCHQPQLPNGNSHHQKNGNSHQQQDNEGNSHHQHGNGESHKQQKNGNSPYRNGNSHSNNGNSKCSVLEDARVRRVIDRNMIVWRASRCRAADDDEEGRLLKRCFPRHETTTSSSDAVVIEPNSMKIHRVDLNQNTDAVLQQIGKLLGKIENEIQLIPSSKRQKLIDERNDAEISSSLAQGLRINTTTTTTSSSRKRKPVVTTTASSNHDEPRSKKLMLNHNNNHKKSIVRRPSLVVQTNKPAVVEESKPGCSKSPDVEVAPLLCGDGQDYRFIIRTMNGTRCDATFPHNAKIKHLVGWMEARGFPSRRYEMVALCPMRQLTTGLDPSVTLHQISLLHREVLHIRRKYHLDTSSSSSSSSDDDDEDL